MSAPKPRHRAGVPERAEDAAIRRVAESMRSASGPPPPGETWIGDDAAVLCLGPGPLVVSTDAVVDGVHFDLSLVGLGDVGWKALTAAVSDLAAMGADPAFALVAFCLPEGTDLDALCDGVAEASSAWACPVVGGDLSSAPALSVTATVAGTVDGPPAATRRDGAHPGDTIFVTGPLGASAAGLRLLRAGTVGDAAQSACAAAYRRPRARLAEGRAARRAGATALLDLSDGLALDLHRLADASGVGFELDTVPTAEGATREEALGGGEDYELVVTTGQAQVLTTAFADAGLVPPVAVGRITDDASRRVLDGSPLAAMGWQHLL